MEIQTLEEVRDMIVTYGRTIPNRYASTHPVEYKNAEICGASKTVADLILRVEGFIADFVLRHKQGDPMQTKVTPEKTVTMGVTHYNNLMRALNNSKRVIRGLLDDQTLHYRMSDRSTDALSLLDELEVITKTTAPMPSAPS